jgi:exopolysaccharide biosynthesis polyprenyl glycosylphosphotransferase
MISMAAAVFAASVLSETWLSRRAGESGRVLVVGTRDGGRELAAEVGRHPELPFDCIGVVLTDVEAADVPQPLQVLGQLANLREIVLREKPDIIVLADVDARAQAIRALLEAVSVDFRVVGLHEFYEYAFGRVPVGELSPMWFMSLLHLYQRPYSRIVKRILDLALSSLALLVALPFVPLLAVLVRLSGPGPIVFRQTRLGEGGEPFEILKFRTMIDGAERPGAAVWAEQRDPRVTPIGRFLRATRLDEIPQLVNVLRGEMSIVGPRPERPEFLDVLADEVPHWTRRHLVKPGITGWAQVRRGYTRDMAGAAEKLSYDLWYVKHCGLVLDLAIAAKTAGTVFSSSDSR